MQCFSSDETALDLFVRHQSKGFLTGLDFFDDSTKDSSSNSSCTQPPKGFLPRQVIEIYGSLSTPKDLLLMHVIASFVTNTLIKEGKHVSEKNLEKVYIFDPEYGMNGQIIRQLIEEKLHQTNPIDKKKKVDDALERIHLYHGEDSTQVVVTLCEIHKDLLEATVSPLLLVLNCVGSFHAIDKMVAKSVGDSLAMTDQLYICLKEFIQYHSPIVFATKHPEIGVARPRHAMYRWETSEYLPSSWSSQVTKRFLIRPMKPTNSSTTETNTSDTSMSFFEKIQSRLPRRFEVKSNIQGQNHIYSFQVKDLQICPMGSLVQRRE